MNREEVSAMILHFKAAFQNMQVNEGTVDIYHLALEKMPIEFVRLAVRDLIKEDREFPPPPGVVYSAAEEYRKIERMKFKGLEAPKMSKEAATKLLEQIAKVTPPKRYSKMIETEVDDDFGTEN